MGQITKKQKEARSKVDKNELHTVLEASKKVKEISSANFDESVDITIRSLKKLDKKYKVVIRE